MVGPGHPPVETQFKPGRAKTGGKKKGFCSPTAALRKLMDKKITYEDVETKKMVQGRIGDVLALRLVLNGCQGEYTALKDILDRLDGKPADKVQHTGKDDGPICLEWEK